MSVPIAGIALGVALGAVGSGYVHALEMTAKCDNALALIATVEPTAKPMPPNGKSPSRLDGALRVVNGTAIAVPYSNRFALLSGARAYVDSVASQAMDFGSIPIEPGGRIDVQVYWPSQTKPGTIATNLTFECKIAKK